MKCFEEPRNFSQVAVLFYIPTGNLQVFQCIHTCPCIHILAIFANGFISPGGFTSLKNNGIVHMYFPVLTAVSTSSRNAYPDPLCIFNFITCPFRWKQHGKLLERRGGVASYYLLIDCRVKTSPREGQDRLREVSQGFGQWSGHRSIFLDQSNGQQRSNVLITGTLEATGTVFPDGVHVGWQKRENFQNTECLGLRDWTERIKTFTLDTLRWKCTQASAWRGRDGSWIYIQSWGSDKSGLEINMCESAAYRKYNHKTAWNHHVSACSE